MKKLNLLFLFTIFIGCLFAQAPDRISYQAVIRNAENKLLSSEPVGMRISILQGSSSGTLVYKETHRTSVNTNGLVSIEIGLGTPVEGTFSSIDWSNGPYFIHMETDPKGGNNYTISGTSELLAVPYALHAKTAERLAGPLSESDPVFINSIAFGIKAADTARWSNNLTIETDPLFNASIAKRITAADTVKWNNKLSVEVDGSVTNELQTLSRSNDTIFLSNGGFIKIPGEMDPQFNSSIAKGITGTDTTRWNNKLSAEIDGSVTNEIQTLSRSNDTVFLSNGGFIKLIPEIDGSVTNEIQTISRSNDTVFLSNGGFIKLPAEIDGSVSNEIQTLSRSNDTVFLSNGGFIKIPAEMDPLFNASLAKGITGADTARWNNKLSTEVDGSVTNEIQMLSISNDTLSLSNGGFIKLPGVTDARIGSMNTHRVARWNGTKLTNGILYDDSVRVGIGTSIPNYMLEVTEDASFNGVRVGKGAGTGTNSTAVGHQALNASTTGTNNTAVGTSALGGNTSGATNSAFGYATLGARTTSVDNTAVGNSALRFGNAGDRNTGVGSGALLNNAGSNNTAIGYQAGNNSTGGNGNVFIGYQAGFAETGSDKLYISNSSAIPPFIYGDFTSGRLGLGTTSPSKKLDVAGDINLTGDLYKSGTLLTLDLSNTNELQTLSRSNDTVFLTNGGFIKLPAEVDGSVTNEIQTLTRSNDTIFLSNGGFIKIPAETDPKIGTIAMNRLARWNGSKLTNGMVYDDSTNVGIGTTSPTSRFQIENYGFSTKTISGISSLLLQSQAPNSRTLFALAPNGTQNADFAIFHNSDYTTNTEFLWLGYENTLNSFILGSNKSGSGSARSLILDATGNGSPLWKQIVLATNGNVGIGTTTPTATLHVAGSSKVNGNDTVGGMLNVTGNTSLTSLTATNLGAGALTDSIVTINSAGVMGKSSLNIGGFDNSRDTWATVAGVTSSATDVLVNGLKLGRGAGGKLENTALGNNALSSNTSGINNTAVGNLALMNVTSGSHNAGFGAGALRALTSGSYNSAFGLGALDVIGSGENNAAFGYASMVMNNSGNNNSAYGTNSLRWGTTGSSNTALGFSSLANANGNNNTAIGFESGNNNSSGSGNVFLGYRAGYTETGSNKLYIANSSNNPPLIYGDFTNGQLGFGTSSLGLHKIVVSAGAYANTLALFSDHPTNNEMFLGKSNNIDKSLVMGYNQSLNYGYFVVNGDNPGTGLVIGNDSKVGIGTTAPTTNFHVVGSSKVTGNDTVGGMLNVTGNTSLTSLTATNLAAGALTDSIVTINSAGVIRKSSLNIGGMDNSKDTWATAGGVTSSATDVLVNGLTIGKGNGNTPSNTALGLGALLTNSTGTFNTATGESALRVNTTGSNNTANGFRTLYANTVGNNNSAFGYEALYSNTTGVNNTSTGYGSLFNNTGGSANTANGVNSLVSNTTGSNNTAIGTSSLFSNTTGNNNTANGLHSLYSNTTGTFNTANGTSSLFSNTTGNNNSANGFYALYHNTTGNRNVAYGQEAGFNNSAGSGNVFLGYQAGYNETGSNKLYIANSSSNPPLIYGDFAATKLGIGTAAPSATLHVVGSSKVTGNDTIGGTLDVTGNATLTTLTATNLGIGALTDSIVTINSAGVMRKSSLALSALDTSNTNEIQTLTRSNDTVFLSNGGFVKLPEQKTIPALITEDDFSYPLPLKNFWTSSVTGAGTITISNSAIVLSTNGTGLPKLYSNKQKAVTEGKLIFTAVLYTYEDNNTAYGPLVRGLVNGVSRNNAIEFINVSGNTIQARTVSGGVATTTNYAVGASVANYYSYTIIASSTKVEFYFDGSLIATHTTNIPTVPLNMYFDASTPGGNVPQVIDKAKFEIIKN